MIRLLLALLLLTACDDRQNIVPPDWDLNRMISQPRYDAFGRSRFFTDERTMRPPPEGTVSRSEVLGPEPLVFGTQNGALVTAIPIPVDRPLLDEGRRHFDVVCSPCHGVLGNGQSVVADNMPLVKPASLQDDRLRSVPDGHLFRVIGEGWGMMPRYGYRLDPRQRWAVVAYVRALQLSQHAPLAELPPPLRDRATRELQP